MSFQAVLLIILATVFIMLCIPVLNIKYNFIDISISLLGFIYVAVFFSFIVLVNSKTYGNYLIWLIFIISWFSDTCAYYIGRKFGKRKLCPDVSPKKTIEGSIGGIIGSVGGVLLWSYFISNTDIIWYQVLLLGVAAGVISQIGDLSASLIKRYIGVKDYGKIMPGHGGILDRFDSILFTAPIVYYYIKIFIGW
jgi:phosphatidate cytidylyltransferase